MKFAVIIILAIFFIYMVIWTLKLYLFNKRQNKVKRIQELRAKEKEGNQQVDNTKDYWYNAREMRNRQEDEDVQKFYHYFTSVEEGVQGLLLEMYDCGIVRTDELTKISYGKDRFQDYDMSALKELEEDVSAEVPTNQEDMTSMDEIIQIDGMLGGFFAQPKKDIVSAAKELKQDDPGITDIHGTLSEGVEDVIAAVEAEEAERNKINEPILVKEEKSVEEARKAREMTANAEVRSLVYEKWTGYVNDLFALIVIHTNEDTKKKIRKALMDYGYSDVDVLLESPDYM